MTHLESPLTLVKKTPEEVFVFLSDFNNFKELMPSQISDWSSDAETCSFNIQGMATLKLKFGKKEPYSLIQMVPDGKPPFDFTLEVLISQGDASGASVKLVLNADMNPFLAMMAEKPLQNFINMLAAKGEEVL